MRHVSIDNVKVVMPLKIEKTSVQEEVVVPSQEELDAAKTKLYTDVKTLELLKAFKNSVSRYGLTRSLISFADHDKSLSSTIPEVPAIENFVTDRSAKNSVVYVEAIEAKIAELTKRISTMAGASLSFEDLNVEQIIKDGEALLDSETILNDSISELKAFRDSVVKYGLTRSLLSFADYKKNLSTYITEIPSIETLTIDRSVSASTDVVVALEGKIADVLKKIMTKIKEKIFSKKKEIVEDEDSKISKMEESLKSGNRVFKKELSDTVKIYNISFDEIMNIMKITRSSYSAIENICNLENPKDDKEFEHWISQVISKLIPVEKVFHSIPDKTGKLEDANSFFRIWSTYDFKPLSELGYNSVEQFYTIYAEYQKTCDMIYSISGIFDDYWKSFYRKDDVSYKMEQKIIPIMKELYESYEWALEWLYKHVFSLLHAIYQCTEEKKD